MQSTDSYAGPVTSTSAPPSSWPAPSSTAPAAPGCWRGKLSTSRLSSSRASDISPASAAGALGTTCPRPAAVDSAMPPLEALQRLGGRLELPVLERQPAQEVIRLLRRRLAGEALRSISLQPFHRLRVLSSFSRRRARTSIASAAVAGGPADATSSAFSASLTRLRAKRACAFGAAQPRPGHRGHGTSPSASLRSSSASATFASPASRNTRVRCSRSSRVSATAGAELPRSSRPRPSPPGSGGSAP